MNGDKKDVLMTAEELALQLVDLRTKFSAVITPCGSRVTCSPPPMDTDIDYLVLIPTGQMMAAELVCHLTDQGWYWDGSEHYQSAVADGFMSWKRGNANLIITSNATFWERHGLATAVCAKLNLMNKSDRITLFQAILYGNVGDKIVSPGARR